MRELGRTLPGVVEGTMYGSPALKVAGRMFTCLAIHRSAEPDTLVVQIPFEQREELIASDPRTYYLTDHYVDYPVVLVRLRRVHRDALGDLLKASRDFIAARAKPSRRTPRRST